MAGKCVKVFDAPDGVSGVLERMAGIASDEP